MKHPDLAGKVALVTRSRRGIGRAIASALAQNGADVAISDIVLNDGLFNKAAEEIIRLGPRSMAIYADIAIKNDIENMVDKIVYKFGRIDILVNCAWIWIPGQTLLECPEDNWDQVMDINLKGTYICCQAAGKEMVKQTSGTIINLSSEVGLTLGTGTGAYSISKAGIIMLTRQLALELAKYRIRVNALAPGVVKTDFNSQFWKDPQVEKQSAKMVPLGRLAEPEDIADSAVFLASDTARYITGEILSVNGGWHPRG
jgi:NAD(P)-dependent dehydrogenase (short-subunit alcohol dehydrogenase family)